MKNYYKNHIHLEPPQGLLNDPNGLSYFKGQYHVFHQWNRFACDHSYKEWGHFSSNDLIHWKHEGSALLPDQPTDIKGIYSGSGIVDKEQLYLFYTGNARVDGKRKSTQFQATTSNGRNFLKEKILETPSVFTEHHRDPKVFSFQGRWYMIVGAQTQEGKGAISLFTSQNLKAWTYQGIFFQDEALDQMCECPDILDFGDYQVLLVCPQKRDLAKDTDISSYSGYYVGKIVNYRFIPETELKPMDEGFDFYAPQTMKDSNNRYLLWAWMSRMSETEEKNCPTLKNGYLHCLTLPREITLKKQQLIQQPAKELRQAFKKIDETSNSQFHFSQGDSSLMLEVQFQEKPAAFQLHLTEQVSLSYKEGKLSLSRKSWVNQKQDTKSFPLDDVKYLTAFLDQSAVEIFLNDGARVLSLRYFPDSHRKKHRFNCPTTYTATLSTLDLGETYG